MVAVWVLIVCFLVDTMVAGEVMALEEEWLWVVFLWFFSVGLVK